ncbi:MAG: hypothetical protein K2X95_03705 [Flavobacteriaceae bacterium]|nr:hypothetical protein [Flavobacteriaceae bacterium]
MRTSSTKQKNNIVFVFVVSFFLLFGFVAFSQTGVGINTTTPKSDFEINGSFAKKITTVTTNTTLDATHSIVVCNNAGTAITIALPAILGNTGRIYTIKKGTSTAGITIDANATETIDGATTVVLSDVKVAITLINDGMEWKAIANYDAQFPMGEISYFSTTGTRIFISSSTTDYGVTNMMVCRPVTSLLARGEFDNGGTNGRLRYIGKNTKIFHIASTISGTLNSGTNATLVFGIAQNGSIKTSSKVLNKFTSTSDAQSTSLHVMLTMAPNDYLELYVGNISTSDDFQFLTFNLVAIGMPD